MKKFATISILSIISVFGAGFAGILGTSGSLLQMSSKLRDDSIVSSYEQLGRHQTLMNEAVRRVLLYERLIQKNHLYMGMVVNRDHYGIHRSECDSLLFSSLRFVALKKLGIEDEAWLAWESIKEANDQGKWHRHPKCRRRSTSRIRQRRGSRFSLTN